MNRSLKILPILLAVGIILSSCGSTDISLSSDKQDYTIGVVVKANGSPYWLDLQSGMKAAASDLDVDLTYLYPSGEDETEEQEKIITDLLNSDIDALMLAPCNCLDTEWVKEAADEKGILLMNVDDRSADVNLPYVGTDHSAIGKSAAEYFAKELPDGANIYILLGPYDQMSCQDRLRGFVSNVDPSLNISGIKFTDMSKNNAYDAIMEAEEEIDGIFCHNVVVAQGAIVAMKERGWDAEIITVDTQEDGELVMKRGNVDAVLIQDGYEIGYQAVKSATDSLRSGEEVEEKHFVSELLTSSGIWEDNDEESSVSG